MSTKNAKTQKDESPSEFSKKPRIDTDPLGSWTGTPDDPNDLPVQEADDL